MKLTSEAKKEKMTTVRVRPERELKLISCASQLNEKIFSERPSFISDSNIGKLFLYTLEKNVKLEVKQSTSSDLHFVYTITTKNALDLATSVYYYFVERLATYQPPHVQEVIAKMEDVLLYFHELFRIYRNSKNKTELATSTTNEDVILCYCTSIFYRLGRFVIPRRIGFKDRKLSDTDEVIVEDNNTGVSDSAFYVTYYNQSRSMNERSKKFGHNKAFQEYNKRNHKISVYTTGPSFIHSVKTMAKKETEAIVNSLEDQELLLLNLLKTQ